ncbi:MAG: hypothetical protein ACM3L6_02455, partial [Deltaproteobacteria bacterium]
HERPLYLMKKSLLKEDEALYGKCVNLYRVRNHLVHKGAPKATLGYELSQKNAKDAIKCALDVFRWFGVRYEYAIPFGDSLVKASEAVRRP